MPYNCPENAVTFFTDCEEPEYHEEICFADIFNEGHLKKIGCVNYYKNEPQHQLFTPEERELYFKNVEELLLPDVEFFEEYIIVKIEKDMKPSMKRKILLYNLSLLRYGLESESIAYTFNRFCQSYPNVDKFVLLQLSHTRDSWITGEGHTVFKICPMLSNLISKENYFDKMNTEKMYNLNDIQDFNEKSAITKELWSELWTFANNNKLT